MSSLDGKGGRNAAGRSHGQSRQRDQELAGKSRTLGPNPGKYLYISIYLPDHRPAFVFALDDDSIGLSSAGEAVPTVIYGEKSTGAVRRH
jgi:hypothetical protein